MNIGDLGFPGWRTVVGHRAVLLGVSIHFRHNIVYFIRYRVVGGPHHHPGWLQALGVVIVTISSRHSTKLKLPKRNERIERPFSLSSINRKKVRAVHNDEKAMPVKIILEKFLLCESRPII